MTEITNHFITLFLANLFSISLLCYGCYFRVCKNTKVAGSFVLFGIGIFLIIFVLHGVDMSMEFAFGLFAVFTMLRYRTDAISIKEMTYLFLVTAIALLSAVSRLSIIELLSINIFICLVAFLIDTRLFQGRTRIRKVFYEKIQNIKPERRQQLIADLTERTGLRVVNVEIVQLDFLKDTAELLVHYIEEKNQMNYSSLPTLPKEELN